VFSKTSCLFWVPDGSRCLLLGRQSVPAVASTTSYPMTSMSPNSPFINYFFVYLFPCLSIHPISPLLIDRMDMRSCFGFYIIRIRWRWEGGYQWCLCLWGLLAPVLSLVMKDDSIRWWYLDGSALGDWKGNVVPNMVTSGFLGLLSFPLGLFASPSVT